MAEKMMQIKSATISKNPLTVGETFKISVEVSEIFLDFAHDYPYEYTNKKED